MRKLVKSLLAGGLCLMPTTMAANAHPHVFVEANIELVRDEAGNAKFLRHVWRFDELFSATTILDFDEDADNTLSEVEIGKLASTVKESISEFDYFTAIRVKGKPAEFYEPEELKAYYEEDKLVMFMEIEIAKPYDFSDGPLRISVSDTSFYVAFDYDAANLTIEGKPDGCSTVVEHPDFDKLYADTSLDLTEAFFDDPSNTSDLGDEFYSWATIDCK